MKYEYLPKIKNSFFNNDMLIITPAAIIDTIINPKASIVFPYVKGAKKVVVTVTMTNIAFFFNELINSVCSFPNFQFI